MNENTETNQTISKGMGRKPFWIRKEMKIEEIEINRKKRSKIEKETNKLFKLVCLEMKLNRDLRKKKKKKTKFSGREKVDGGFHLLDSTIAFPPKATKRRAEQWYEDRCCGSESVVP